MVGAPSGGFGGGGGSDAVGDLFQNPREALLWRLVFGVDAEVGRGGFGFFEDGIAAGEVGDAAFLGFFVEAFGVAGLAGGEAGVDVDFEEIVGAHDLAGEGAERPIRADERAEGDEAAVDEEFGDFGDAADVFAAVVFGEAEAGIEAGAEVIAVEEDGGAALGVEGSFEEVGEGAFSGAREAVEPDDMAALAEERFLGGPVQLAVELGVDVRGHCRVGAHGAGKNRTAAQMFWPRKVWMPHSVLSNPSQRPARS